MAPKRARLQRNRQQYALRRRRLHRDAPRSELHADGRGQQRAVRRKVGAGHGAAQGPYRAFDGRRRIACIERCVFVRRYGAEQLCKRPLRPEIAGFGCEEVPLLRAAGAQPLAICVHRVAKRGG